MKIRVKGNSLGFRISPSDVDRLVGMGRIEETTRFAPEGEVTLTFVLEHEVTEPAMSARYTPREVTVVVATEEVNRWAAGEQVAMFRVVGAGDWHLSLLVAKDFARLDRRDDAENQDMFPNPKQGVAC